MLKEVTTQVIGHTVYTNRKHNYLTFVDYAGVSNTGDAVIVSVGHYARYNGDLSSFDSDRDFYQQVTISRESARELIALLEKAL